MNLGINYNGNKWQYIIINFLVIFLAQMVFELYDLLALNKFPSLFQVYKAVVQALIATIAFYGINRQTHKES